jgi:hypothetical protein
MPNTSIFTTLQFLITLKNFVFKNLFRDFVTVSVELLLLLGSEGRRASVLFAKTFLVWLLFGLKHETKLRPGINKFDMRLKPGLSQFKFIHLDSSTCVWNLAKPS